MAEQYDLIVIGTGPGGYVCAIRAAQLGLKTAVVEKRAQHGGTCLNVGCIPSKALLHASELFEEAGHKFAGMGINVSPSLDLGQMQAFKSEGIKGNVDGIAFLLKKNKIDAFHGLGRIDGAGQVSVIAEGGETTTLATKNIVIATGSDVANLPGIEIDEKTVVSSTGALDLETVPAKMLVIGAGVIGLELGSVWRRLGSEVHVVEYLDRILPGMDAEVAKQFQRILKRQGMSFQLSTKVTGVAAKPAGGHSVTVEPAAGGDAQSIDADVVLVCIGRVPFTEGLGLEAAGVEMEGRGMIKVDAHFQTNVPASSPLAMLSAGRCSPTRPKTKALPLPKFSQARPDT